MLVLGLITLSIYTVFNVNSQCVVPPDPCSKCGVDDCPEPHCILIEIPDFEAKCQSNPTKAPTIIPTIEPTINPTVNPTKTPSKNPTRSPSTNPTQTPSINPTKSPSINPTDSPSKDPTRSPSINPTKSPSTVPTKTPSINPTHLPSKDPTPSPSINPTNHPTLSPIDSTPISCGNEINGTYLSESNPIYFALDLKFPEIITINDCGSEFDAEIVLLHDNKTEINECNSCCDAPLTANISAGLYYFQLLPNQEQIEEEEGFEGGFSIEISCNTEEPTSDPTINPTETSVRIIDVISNLTNFTSAAPIIEPTDERKTAIWVWCIIGIGGCCCLLLCVFMVFRHKKENEEERGICTEDIKLSDVNQPSRSYSNSESDDDDENSELQRFMNE